MIKRLKYSSFILLLIFISSTLFAKPILKDSLEAYNYWARRGIIEMVYANMQDYLTTVDTLKNSKEKTLTKVFFHTYIAKINLKDIKEIDDNYKSINRFLIDNKLNKARVLFQSLSDKQYKQIPLNDQFFSENLIPPNNKYWNLKIKDILKNYKIDLQTFQNKSANFDSEVRNQHLGFDKEIKANSDINLILILSFFVGGLFVGGFLFYLYTEFEIYSILKTEKKEYSQYLHSYQGKYHFKYLQIVAILKDRKDKKNEDIHNLKDEVSNLKKEISKNSSKYDGSDYKLNNSIREVELVEEKMQSNVIEFDIKSNVESIDVTNKKTKTNEIFFTIPENDGSFKITNGRNTKGVDCFYKIEVDKNRQKGKLHFISGDLDSRALDNIDYYLSPVCQIENITERAHARKIHMKESGNVLMSSDCWKIDINHKVKIKLI